MAFDWAPNTAPEISNSISQIIPTEVLYDFDGPMLFLTTDGPIPVLCYKIDELEDSSQFVVVPTNAGIVHELKQGLRSLRSALDQAWAWVVETDSNYIVKKSWQFPINEIPSELLPKWGFGIYSDHGAIKERRAVSARPFLSIHFQGGEGAPGGTLPFGVFVGLMNDVYDSAWKIFSPAIRSVIPHLSDRTIRRALSVPLHEPAFSSLLIEFERPRLDVTQINEGNEIDLEKARASIVQANEEFLQSLDTVTAAARKGRLRNRMNPGQLEALDVVAQLVPNSNSYFDTVVFQGIGVGQTEHEFTIDSETGQKIWDEYKISSNLRRSYTGVIVEISDRSISFIIRRRNSREVTCLSHLDALNNAFKLLHRGMTVTVEGNFQERKRRDRIWVDKITVDGKQTIA